MLLVSSIPSDKKGEKGKVMKSIELVTRCLMQLVIAAAVAFLCVRGLTGCRYLASPEAKAKVVESLKTAYAEGGRTAVSNKIEKLVETGEDALHVVADVGEFLPGERLVRDRLDHWDLLVAVD